MNVLMATLEIRLNLNAYLVIVHAHNVLGQLLTNAIIALNYLNKMRQDNNLRKDTY